MLPRLATIVRFGCTDHALGTHAIVIVRVVSFTQEMHDEGGVLVVVVVFPLEKGALVGGGSVHLVQMVRLGAVAVCRCQPVAGWWDG